jgi:hypothetical protein
MRHVSTVMWQVPSITVCSLWSLSEYDFTFLLTRFGLLLLARSPRSLLAETHSCATLYTWLTSPVWECPSCGRGGCRAGCRWGRWGTHPGGTLSDGRCQPSIKSRAGVCLRQKWAWTSSKQQQSKPSQKKCEIIFWETPEWAYSDTWDLSHHCWHMPHNKDLIVIRRIENSYLSGRDTKDRLLACNITCNGMIQKENSL